MTDASEYETPKNTTEGLTLVINNKPDPWMGLGHGQDLVGSPARAETETEVALRMKAKVERLMQPVLEACDEARRLGLTPRIVFNPSGLGGRYRIEDLRMTKEW